MPQCLTVASWSRYRAHRYAMEWLGSGRVSTVNPVAFSALPGVYPSPMPVVASHLPLYPQALRQHRAVILSPDTHTDRDRSRDCPPPHWGHGRPDA
jgi:hypothetical protein